jgi:phosphatidylserine/phosphatidylglycerophosphate/cardiolipin synthase-like enzyme
LVYLRGDGCGQSSDTDTAEDWKLRWTRLGAATPCVDGTITDLANMRPLIAPEAGLLDLVRWIDGANTSLDVQVYQIHEPNLIHALIRAVERNVTVRVVMDAGDSWWSSSDMRAIDGVAAALTDAGAEVLLLGAEDDDPYAFMHAKLAVRDGNEVWLGSGNWKSSSTPKSGDAGNRDWGLLVHSPELADTLGELLAMDRDVASVYVRPASAGTPNGWTLEAAQSLSGTEVAAVAGTANGEVLTCPDDCILGLVGMLDNAQSEALLSLQYLEMDWSWGWGENPLLAAMHEAAERGIRLRVALNGAYLDDDMQSVVDLLNEDWNATQGHDVAAVIMSPGDNVSKLHNKGAIIDGTSVLISSINWGDSSMLRNREVGLLVHHAPLASVFHASWTEDWNRVDDSTDSDNDGLLDAWELEHGLNRARRTATGSSIEADLDPDGDGLTHLDEFNLGSNPNSNDTDGDCISDDLEVARAQADPSGPSAADRITMADADGDGAEDHSAEGCTSNGTTVDDNVGNTTNDDEQNVTSPDDDVDLDGVAFGEDRCPATPQGDPVDAEGCSADQRRLRLSDGEEEEDAFGWFLPAIGIVGLLVVITGAMGLRKSKDEPDLDTSMPVEMAATKPLVVLDGRPSDADFRARLTGWDDAVIEERLSEGWTLEGLVEYYEKEA